MKFFPSMISSVYTDGNIQSVVTNWITDGMFRIKKKNGSLTWRFLRVIFSDGIIKGFKTEALYGDVTGSPFQMLMEFPRDSKRQIRMVTRPFTVRIADGLTDGIRPLVKLSEKVNIYPLCRPSPPLFLLLHPHPNSPQLQTTRPPPPKKKKTSYISWSFVVTTSVFWFTDGFYQFL